MDNGVRELLIVVEGETELTYIRELVSVLKLTKKVEIRLSAQKDPGLAFKAIAQEMLWDERVENVKFQEAWLVFDRDEHSGYAASIALCDKFENIHLAFSNPCFEFWLLMHYKTLPKLSHDKELVIERKVEVETISKAFQRRVTTEVVERITSPQRCLQMLKTKCPTFRKNASSYLDIFGHRLHIAYKHAQAFGDPAHGHGTTLVKLIDRLCELAKLTPEQLFVRLNPNYVIPLMPGEEEKEKIISERQFDEKDLNTRQRLVKQLVMMLSRFQEEMEIAGLRQFE